MTTTPRPREGRARPGSTLLELMVIVAITGILAAIAVPSYKVALEQARVDQAAATLRTIWAAQRFYKLDNASYAAGLEPLQQAGLLDDDLDTTSFAFAVDPSGFPITATRAGGQGTWTGALSVDAEGVITGSVSADGRVVSPALLFNNGQQ